MMQTREEYKNKSSGKDAHIPEYNPVEDISNDDDDLVYIEDDQEEDDNEPWVEV